MLLAVRRIDIGIVAYARYAEIDLHQQGKDSSCSIGNDLSLGGYFFEMEAKQPL